MIEQRNVIVARSRGVASPTRLTPNYPSTSPSASLLKNKKEVQVPEAALSNNIDYGHCLNRLRSAHYTDICLELHKGFIACRLHEGLTACRHDPWVKGTSTTHFYTRGGANALSPAFL